MANRPPRLKARAWNTSQLIALEDAPTRYALTRDPWIRPHRGVVVWGDQDITAPMIRISCASEAVGGAPLGTWAAAFLHGARDLDGGRGLTDPEPVVFCLDRPGSKRPRDGLLPLRSPLDAEDVTTVGGIAVTSPARTAFDLARTARSLHQAVAAVDCLLRVHPAVLTVEQFEAYVQTLRGFKGIRQVRDCIPLLSPLARSRPESVFRVIWQVDAGLPKPLVNPRVITVPGRRLLGYPDLLAEEEGLAGEYDGEYHRDLNQHARDNAREEAFEDAGLTVVRATSVDLRDRRALVERLQRGFQRAQRQQTRSWMVLR
ncbi:MAG TPA: hypothetical protein VFX33_11165 [Actinomycetales bacterium]|nr:hypothetical protein [Actinomycetales bacterium]